MTITEICAALEALECARDKATPGPWVIKYGSDIYGDDFTHIDNDEGIVITEAEKILDSHLIVASRNFPISFRKIAKIVKAAHGVMDTFSEAGEYGSPLSVTILGNALAALDEVKP